MNINIKNICCVFTLFTDSFPMCHIYQKNPPNEYVMTITTLNEVVHFEI